MDQQDFIADCLREHNKFRELHGVPHLRHSINLDKSAQEWAEDLIQKDNLHNSPVSSRGEVGENISMRSSSTPKVHLTGADVCKQWYNDIKNFDFKRHNGPAGNFTQMVWKATEEVGFGISHVKGRCIVVAHYRPPGNVRGNYSENVLPPKGLDDSYDEKEMTNNKHPIDENDLGISSKFNSPLKNKSSATMSDDEEFEREIKNKNEIDKAHARHIRQFTRDTINGINRCRVKHGVDELKHNKELDNMAQKWADDLVEKSTLSNSNNSYKGDRVGENISSRWSNDKCEYQANEVVDHWYEESAKYKFDAEPQNVQGIGNFTQMVWKNTKEIGVGKAIKVEPDDSRVVVVCNFYPAGNVLRKFKLNVLPVKN